MHKDAVPTKAWAKISFKLEEPQSGKVHRSEEVNFFAAVCVSACVTRRPDYSDENMLAKSHSRAIENLTVADKTLLH